MNIFLAPHNDDETLFGSYIIQRTKPLVIVATDGTTHEKFGVSAKNRQEESIEAAKMHGVDVEFFHLDEQNLTRNVLMSKLWALSERFEPEEIDHVFAPAKQGGHAQHDLLSDCVTDIFEHILYYSTYAKRDLTPVGEMPINPTIEEKRIKEAALLCYPSQLRINPEHFAAIAGQPEYLSFKQ